uniref:C2H2-type domain-containing protein n=1 Tax=Ditylenchus dipsaci TaxID=166011 RepID=A0A915DZY7_9BILA
MSTDDDDEGHDRLVIDDPMDDVASTQSTPRKATINSVNSNAPEDVDMEEGELIDSAETILQSPVSSKTKEKRQIAGTSTLLDGDSVKSASSSSGISAKEKSAIGFKAPNDTDNGHHHSDQKSADSMQPVKPIWKKSVSPSCDSVYNKKSAGTAEASSSTSNSTNTKRSLKQDLDASADEPPASKKKKVQMVDKSTCVLTKACQLEDALLSLKPGSTACLNITIVCKAGANTLYILAKWKGKEYHGVLTDGEPVHSHLYAQKRADKNSDHTTPNSAAGGGHSDKTGVSSTGKVRGKRGANRQVAGATDKKNRHADDATENNYASGDPNSSLNCKSQEEGGSLPSTAKSSTSKQYELASDKSFVRRCPHKQCGYRFESMSEVNTHLVMGHADTRATMCEAIATQTDPIETTCMGVQTCEPEPQERLCSKCKQSTSTDQDDSSKMCPSSNTAVQKITEEKSLQDLFKVVRSNCEKKLGGESGTKSSTSPDAFSDISDDGAPMLEKEENFESNKTGADKKTAVNEPIEIIPPTENTGPLWTSFHLCFLLLLQQASKMEQTRNSRTFLQPHLLLPPPPYPWHPH